MKRILMRFRLPVLFLCSLGMAATLSCGCRSTHVPESNRAAAVILTNHPSKAITAATVAVFKSHAYERARPSGNELVFQKPGTLANSFWFGDWYSGPVWRRVRVYQRELDPARTLLDCDVYMVQQAEDPLFQKGRKRSGRDSTCQELLDEVAATLNRKEVAPQADKP